MATPSDVDSTLRALVERLDAADLGPKASTIPGRNLVCNVSDLGLVYVAEYREGRIAKLSRVPDGSVGDVAVTVSSDDLVALAGGRMSVMPAILTGRLRVDASAGDLLLLRQIFR